MKVKHCAKKESALESRSGTSTNSCVLRKEPALLSLEAMTRQTGVPVAFTYTGLL